MDGVYDVLASFPSPQTPSSALEQETARHITALTNLRNSWSVPFDDEELLKALNPTSNSVSYLYALLAFLDSSEQSSGAVIPLLKDDGSVSTSPLWQNILVFADAFDPIQLQYARDGILELFSKIKQAASSSLKPLYAILPIKTITQRLGPQSQHAHSIRTSYLATCLELRRFRAALPILKEPLNGSLRGESYEALLEYHSYAGLVYSGLKQWALALEHFSLVISAVTRNVLHSLMVEAYKKWILISLIHNGQLVALPKIVPATSRRFLYALSHHYNELAESFTDGNAQKLRSLLIQHQEVWKKDTNFGLALQAYVAFNRWNLLKVQKVYKTYPLDRIKWESVESSFGGSTSEGEESQSREVESGILDIVEHTSFGGTIEHTKSGSEGSFLVFSDSAKHTSNAASEAAMVGRLEKQTQEITDMTASIKQIDRRFSLRKEYLMWLKKAAKDGPMALPTGPGSGDPMDLGWDELEIEGENSPVE